MFQVTHTLPEETYKAWLHYAAAVRFIGQNRTVITLDNAKDWLILGMVVIVQDDSTRIHKTLPTLVEVLQTALHNSEPVAPEVFIVATFYRALDFIRHPTTSEDFVASMITISHMIATTYAKNLGQVMEDLTQVFAEMDESFDKFKSSKP